MQELIAKRYVKALKGMGGEAEFENLCTLFGALAAAFSEAKFAEIFSNPDVSSETQKEILLAAVKPAQSDAVNNFVALLVEKKRVALIPAIAAELGQEIAAVKKNYRGTVYSNSEMDTSALKGLSEGLGKKVDAAISLDFVKNDFDGVKVEVPDLNIEINFSKSRVNSQLVDHILKAI